jgi:hypothetical protein
LDGLKVQQASERRLESKMVIRFGVVTPLFRPERTDFLLECLHSVKAQARGGELAVWHHVQDGGSGSDVQRLLAAWQAESAKCSNYKFTFESAPDAGMYDAINKGFNLVLPHADWIAHLNADEQYLATPLSDMFAEAKNNDVVLANVAVLDSEDRYICSRRPLQPWKQYIRVWIPAQTCASFYRAAFLRESQVRYSTRWRSISDSQFYIDVYESGARFRRADVFTSIFRHGEGNLGLAPVTSLEKAERWRELPAWLRRIQLPLVYHMKARKCWNYIWSKKITKLLYFKSSGELKEVRVKDRLRWGLRGWQP